jgi:hypothetical protein
MLSLTGAEIERPVASKPMRRGRVYDAGSGVGNAVSSVSQSRSSRR